MQKLFLCLFIFLNILRATECSPYYNPEKFYEVPELLKEFLEEQLPSGVLFETQKNSSGFVNQEDTYLKKNSFITQGEYLYPTKTGLWQYKIIKGKKDELNIARVELYRFSDEEIANSINDDFDYFWQDFIEDGYSMQLTPEQTLFRYNDEYFSFSVFIYGVVGDTTPLKGTVVNFWFKNYSNEVNEFIQCKTFKKEINGSR